MIWLTWKLLTLPFRTVFGVLGLSYKTVRFVGVSRILAFGAGVAAGLAIAPEKGAAFRESVVRRVNAATAPVDLADSVRKELAQSPRTWHLPQPTVVADGDRITITGDVPHETARADLGRVAGSVVGVKAVDNRIEVDDGGSG